MEKLISLYGQHDLVQELKGDYSSSQIKKFKLSKTSFDSIILCHSIDKLVGRHIFFFDTEDQARDYYYDLTLLCASRKPLLLEPSFVIKNKAIEEARNKQAERARVIHSFLESKNAQ